MLLHSCSLCAVPIGSYTSYSLCKQNALLDSPQTQSNSIPIFSSNYYGWSVRSSTGFVCPIPIKAVFLPTADLIKSFWHQELGGHVSTVLLSLVALGLLQAVQVKTKLLQNWRDHVTSLVPTYRVGICCWRYWYTVDTASPVTTRTDNSCLTPNTDCSPLFPVFSALSPPTLSSLPFPPLFMAHHSQNLQKNFCSIANFNFKFVCAVVCMCNITKTMEKAKHRNSWYLFCFLPTCSTSSLPPLCYLPSRSLTFHFHLSRLCYGAKVILKY